MVLTLWNLALINLFEQFLFTYFVHPDLWCYRMHGGLVCYISDIYKTYRVVIFSVWISYERSYYDMFYLFSIIHLLMSSVILIKNIYYSFSCCFKSLKIPTYKSLDRCNILVHLLITMFWFTFPIPLQYM